MGYKMRAMTLDEAKTLSAQYEFCLIHSMSSVFLGKTAACEVNWAELLEARFFDAAAELHIFKCEKVWRAVLVSDDEQQEDSLTFGYALANKFCKAGKRVMVKEYLAADEDGQMYSALARLCAIV